jgi:predicted ATPase
VSVAPLPFVGRADAMRQLEARLTRALAGEGGLCLLVGEAGIGKTRCAEELRARAASQGVRMWTGRSVEGLGAPVFWPWIQVLREAVREEAGLREAGESLLARMAAFDADGNAPEAGERKGGKANRFWVLDGLSRFLLDAAAHLHLVVLLEDLHWADSATLEVLAFLVRELPRSRLLLVGTMRNETLERDRSRVEQLMRGAERIDLAHLTPEDVGRYIGELTRRTPSPSLCGAVYRASAGNPLFLQETVRTLIA